MKLRNKILAFAAPAAAIATVMPIALTSCSVTVEAPSTGGTVEGGATWWKFAGTHDVNSKTKFITTVSAETTGANRITFLAQPKDSEKYLKTGSCKVNGKSLKVHEVVNVSGDKVWVCDSTEAFTKGADLKLEFSFAESGKECSIKIAIGEAA